MTPALSRAFCGMKRFGRALRRVESCHPTRLDNHSERELTNVAVESSGITEVQEEKPRASAWGGCQDGHVTVIVRPSP